MRVLITGAAGFIGYHLSKLMICQGHEVMGLDNINDYYSPALKFARLEKLGISQKKAEKFRSPHSSTSHPNFHFTRMHLEDKEALTRLFEREKFEVVCNLAAQAGVRYSLTNPDTYVQSNIVGFLNILECCRHNGVKHLVYASSSSVYGLNKKIPFSVNDPADQPISLYAASKKSNELMAHAYSQLFSLPTTGLRFFTVYGPWGRPDMALFLFTDAIIKNKPIQVFNHGNMERDFTYIDDIVEGVRLVMENDLLERDELYQVYNIGNNQSVKLMDFIREIEKNLGKQALKEMLPMQPGDVSKTWADVKGLISDFEYQPNTSIQKGIQEFIIWYKQYFKIS